jgi:aldose sugar dehydrogenase
MEYTYIALMYRFEYSIHMKKLILILLILSTAVFGSPYKVEKVFQGDEIIWSFDFIGPNELIFTERSGKAFYYSKNTKVLKNLAVPNIKKQGQGGLLDIKLHKIDGKQYVYFTYSEEVNGVNTTSLARGLYANKEITDIKRIFRTKIEGDGGRHFGSRLLFHGDHLYMTMGDRGERKAAQKLSVHNGKVLRLNFDGTTAKGNPFINKKEVLPEIWSYGHRNPQGIDLDPVSKNIYSCEFGPRGGDELNRVVKEKNYGWPLITYGKEYWGPSIGDTHKKGMEQPVTYWTPSISPSGMVFYTGDKIPEWKNNLFLAALGSTHLRRLVLKNNKVIKQEVLFDKLEERIRHVRTGLDGHLYFSTDSGAIFRVNKVD